MKSRRKRWAGHMACTGERKTAQRVLVEKSEGPRPLGRPRYSWEDNINMDLQKMTWGHGLDRSDTG
jgi:hypothetical protein